MSAMVVITDDITIFPFFKGSLGLLRNKPIAIARAVDDPEVPAIFHKRVGSRITDNRKMVIIGFVRCPGENLVFVVVGIGVDSNNELPNGAFTGDALGPFLRPNERR